MPEAQTTRRSLLKLFGLAPIAAAPAAATSARTPILLLKTRVNGECYYEAATCVGDLRLDDPVQLRREPSNRYDSRAIEVLDGRGRKLGYVARIDNSAVARMMDAGERVQARIARLDIASLDIRIDVEWLPRA
jgi:hypothetical protein